MLKRCCWSCHLSFAPKESCIGHFIKHAHYKSMHICFREVLLHRSGVLVSNSTIKDFPTLNRDVLVTGHPYPYLLQISEASLIRSFHPSP